MIPTRNKSALIFCAILLLGIIQIVLTYNDLSQTWDGPTHIVAGMGWLQNGTYTFDHEDPPLARIFDALGLYVAGIRMKNNADMWTEGNELLFTRGHYFRNLALARLGSLFFFILAFTIVWIWARKNYGLSAAAFSVFLLATLPPVLAHSGIATTDIAAAACLLAALFVLNLWLENTCSKNSVLLGASCAAAFLTKFSNIAFLLLCGIIIVSLHLLSRGQRKSDWPLKFGAGSMLALIVCFCCIWAMYRFSFAALNQVAQHYSTPVSPGKESGMERFFKSLPLPAPEFLSGMLVAVEHNREGHLAYLLGDTYMKGRWPFFPLALAIKTPLPFLLLSAYGIWLFARAAKEEPKNMILPCCAIAVLSIGMASNLNLGIRHILALYLPLCIVGGVAASFLLQEGKNRTVRVALLAILLASQLISCLRVHPDYLAYYNFLGGAHPENILLDTSDWGQDAARLGTEVRRRKISSLFVCYRGSADLDRFGLTNRKRLTPYKMESGWIAASLLCNKMGDWSPPYDQFSWLDKFQPVGYVGKSIRLYYIPKNQVGRSSTDESVP